MRLLIDGCVAAYCARALAAAGHDVERVSDWSADPGDSAILARAVSEGRTLVTLDRDMPALAILGGARHAGILRLVEARPERQAMLAVEAIARYGAELERGAIVTAELTRTRLRRPE